MVNEELLKKIKDALDFTFDDEDTDRKIIGIIEDAIPILRSLFGTPDDEEIDWTIPSQERFLLKNYCLYELNHDYRNDILQVRRKYEVRQWRDFQDSMTE